MTAVFGFLFVGHRPTLQGTGLRRVRFPFVGHRPPLQLQWLDSINKMLFAEIKIMRIPIVHPRDFVTGRVSHEVEKKGVFIHHSRVGIEFGHLMGFVEFNGGVALQNQITKHLLVATMVPEVERAVLNREVIPVFKQIENKWAVFEQDHA